MTGLALDDFDRTGALGSLWTAYGSGVFLCDGDRAYDSGLPGVEHAATMAVALGASDLYPRKVSVKVRRPKLNAGTAEFAILLAPFLNSASAPPILNVKEVGWRSDSGGQIYVKTRTLLPAMVGYPTTQLAVAYAWPEEEVRTLEARVINAGATVEVWVNGVVIGSVPNATVVTANIAGLYAKRGAVSAGSAPADPIRFDLFKVDNFAAGYSSELAPVVAASPSLTSVVLDTEGLIASAVALPIRAPDKTWTETGRWRTDLMPTGSGHKVRFPLSSKRRDVRNFQWSGLTDAELTTLRAFFDDDPAGIGTYTTPEGQALYFALASAAWDMVRTGPKSRRVTVAVVQVHAT